MDPYFLYKYSYTIHIYIKMSTRTKYRELSSSEGRTAESCPLAKGGQFVCRELSVLLQDSEYILGQTAEIYQHNLHFKRGTATGTATKRQRKGTMLLSKYVTFTLLSYISPSISFHYILTFILYTYTILTIYTRVDNIYEVEN